MKHITPARKVVQSSTGPRVLEMRVPEPLTSTQKALSQGELRSEYNRALFEAPHPSEVVQLPEPPALAALPHYHGFAVGFMFYRDDAGVPDFKHLIEERVEQCANERLCGLCGGPLGELFTIVGGPLCMKNRVSTDPPFHYECARYAVQVCPFMLGKEYAKASTLRRSSGKEALFYDPALAPPPVVNGLLQATTYRRFTPTREQGGDGRTRLFDISDWVRVEWFRRLPRGVKLPAAAVV